MFRRRRSLALWFTLIALFSACSSTPTIVQEGTMPPPAATYSPTPTLFPTQITDGKGVRMALIPAGEFQMGSETGESHEQPVHTVYVSAFYMDIYEVTNEAFAACVQAGECSPPSETGSNTRSSYYGDPDFASYPVVMVDWSQASEYCGWRGGRLPSEAEWEKAARGGLEGMRYPWGDENPVCTPGAENGANFGDCSPDDTVEVGSFGANGYGLYDMAGNVCEWVNDWYDSGYYGNSPEDNPQGPASGQNPVLRGGGWYSPVAYYTLRAASRNLHDPVNWGPDIGFRCAAAAGSFLVGQVRALEYHQRKLSPGEKVPGLFPVGPRASARGQAKEKLLRPWVVSARRERCLGLRSSGPGKG